MFNRRKFLRLGFLGMGALAITDIAYSVSGSQLPSAISEILHQDLSGLKCNSEHINEFVKDVVDKNALGMNFTHTQLIMLYYKRPVKHIRLPFNRRYKQLRNDIVAKYLLSTDFFYNQMDVSKPVNYSGSVYKAYETACLNPFSGMYYKS